jgi:hypothetical protein
MKLKPVREYPERAYPRASDRLVKSLFLAASMTATSLGGCAPLPDELRHDAAAVHDLDATVDKPVADAPAPDKPKAQSVDSDKVVDSDKAVDSDRGGTAIDTGNTRK